MTLKIGNTWWNNFAHAQMLSRMSSLSGRMNIGLVYIEFFPGWKKIKQRSISFALGYLRMILWKISTAISLWFFIKRMACMPLKQNIKMSMVTDYVENQPLWLKWYIALLFLKFIQAQLNRTFPTMDVNNQSILSFSASLFTYSIIETNFSVWYQQMFML